MWLKTTSAKISNVALEILIELSHHNKNYKLRRFLGPV